MVTTAEKFETLVDTIDAFVNGAPDQLITTVNGQINTLSGIAKRALNSGYIQKVLDYRTLTQAAADALAGSLLVPGNMVRIYGETAWVDNGLYEVQDDKSLLRVDYSDINNLNNLLEGSVGLLNVTFTPSQIQDTNTNVVLRYTFAKDEVRSFAQALTGEIRMFSNKTGQQGVSFARFSLNLFRNGTTLAINTTYSGQHVTNVLGGTLPTTLPTFVAVLNQYSNYDEIVVRANYTDFTGSDPVKIEIQVQGINKANFL